MKLVICILTLVIFTNASVNNASLTKEERDYALSYLKQTQKDLQNAVKGLSEAQLKFKASPERWSIAECLEHITLAETGISAGLEKIQKDPADGSKRNEIKWKDEDIVKAMTDRSQKANAPENLKPTGKYASSEATLKAFIEQREKTEKWIETTSDDLRNHLMPHPFFGILDSYQWVLFEGAHGKRHTLQIEEVKADPNFPKK